MQFFIFFNSCNNYNFVDIFSSTMLALANSTGKEIPIAETLVCHENLRNAENQGAHPQSNPIGT